MSENPPPQSPKREVIAPRHESLAAEFSDEPVNAQPNYGEARLWLAARDPRTLFAYWDFRPEEHPANDGADGQGRFYLRTFRNGGAAESTIEIQPGAGNLFLTGQAPESAYMAEVGFFTADVWCFVAHSEIVRTPPELRDEEGAAIFATIPPDIGLQELRRLLADSALPGEPLAMTAARLERDARRDGHWTPERQRLLAQLLGEADTVEATSPANSTTLTGRIRRRLDAAANAAAPTAPARQADLDDVHSAGSSWPSSPGGTSSR
jgi:hypothetical protein